MRASQDASRPAVHALNPYVQHQATAGMLRTAAARTFGPANCLQGARPTVDAPEVTPTASGPSRSHGTVSTSSPDAILCVIALRATSMQAAELTQYDGTPFSSGISCARTRVPGTQRRP